LNALLISAGILSIMIALVHSILGEHLVFKKLRADSLVPTITAPPLTERNIRVLWATWHLASFFGFAIGAILIDLAGSELVPAFIANSIALAMTAC